VTVTASTSRIGRGHQGATAPLDAFKIDTPTLRGVKPVPLRRAALGARRWCGCGCSGGPERDCVSGACRGRPTDDSQTKGSPPLTRRYRCYYYPWRHMKEIGWERTVDVGCWMCVSGFWIFRVPVEVEMIGINPVTHQPSNEEY
jgi:hypothetical protein